MHGAWTCALFVLSTGCSASTATMECRRAERLLRSASTSATAPAHTYELTLARAYLEKAREEASEAHYGSAIELANASQRASQRARAPYSAHASGAASGIDSAKGRD